MGCVNKGEGVMGGSVVDWSRRRFRGGGEDGGGGGRFGRRSVAVGDGGAERKADKDDDVLFGSLGVAVNKADSV